MSSYLPYIIVAGIVVIFFIICMILFSGNKAEKNHQKQERAEQQSLAQKRARRVAHQVDATGTHKKAHAQACPAIKVDTRGTGDEHSRQDRTRGDHVISGVDGSSEKRPRIDAIPQAPIE